MGTLTHGRDGDYSWIAIARVSSTVLCPITGDAGIVSNPTVCCYTTGLTASAPPSLYKVCQEHETLTETAAVTGMKLTHYDPEYVSEPHPDDERLIGAAFSLGIRLLLALAARPEYLDAAAGGSRSPGKGGNEWTPVRWAGRGHRHTVASGDDSRGEGVRLHWRRGHFRNQPYGEGRALRKIIWLEPVLVGGDGK